MPAGSSSAAPEQSVSYPGPPLSPPLPSGLSARRPAPAVSARPWARAPWAGRLPGGGAGACRPRRVVGAASDGTRLVWAEVVALAVVTLALLVGLGLAVFVAGLLV